MVLKKKIRARLEGKGMKVRSIKKTKGGFLYRISVPLTSSSTTPRFNIKLEDGSELKGIHKKSAKKEFGALEKLGKDMELKESFKVPKPCLLMEDEKVVIMEQIKGKSLSELIVDYHFFLGPSKDQLEQVFKEIGSLLGFFHRWNKTGNDMELTGVIRKSLEKVRADLPDDITKEIDCIDMKGEVLPEVYIHGDIGLGNIIHSEKLGLVDWTGLKRSWPLRDLSRFKSLLKRKNKYCFRINLERFFNLLLDSYQETVEFGFDKNTMYLSDLARLLHKIERNPERAKRKKYLKLLESSLEKIE